jgi:hypothetical protein
MPWKVERVHVDRGMLYCKGKEELTLIDMFQKVERVEDNKDKSWCEGVERVEFEKHTSCCRGLKG